MEMKKYKLGDVLEEFHSGNNIKAVDIKDVGEYPVFGANGLRGYTDRYNCDGDVAIIGRQGAYCGNVKFFSGKAYYTEHAVIAKPKKGFDAKYLACKLPFYQLEKYQGQSAQPGLSVGTLSLIEVELPSYENQKEVALVLSALDKRIENLRAQNRVLEQTAKTIYDYTFLQCAGHQTTYNKTLNRNIPADWEVKKMEEVLLPIERGISYSSEEIKSGKGMPMYNLACFDKQGNYRSGELKFYSGEYKKSDLIKLGDMLIACTDLTRNADIIGTPVIVNDEYDFFVFSTDLAKITPKNEDMKYHIYFWLKNSSYRKYIKPFASGTNVLHLNVRGVLDYPILVPDSSVLKNLMLK